MTWKKLALALSVTALVGGAACSSDSTSTPSDAASFCDQLDATKQAFDGLKNVDIVTSGTSGLQSALTEVESSLKALGDAGTAEFSAQIAVIQTAASSLKTSIGSIDSSNLAGAAAEIGPELTALGTAVQGLVDGAGQCT